MCGDSAESGNVVGVECRSDASAPLVGIGVKQVVRLTLATYGPIRQLLPALIKPSVLDSLAFDGPPDGVADGYSAPSFIRH